MVDSPLSAPMAKMPEVPWYSAAEVGSPRSAGGLQEHPAVHDPIALRPSCSVRSLSSYIDSCAKARVIAIMALETLVYGGKLHSERSNWACPFSNCKENFVDTKNLMHHIMGCPYISSDSVYCNSCRGYACLSPQNQHFRFCRGCESSDCGERISPKKINTIRKLANMFNRSRAGSRASSPVSVSHHDPSPTSGNQIETPPTISASNSPAGIIQGLVTSPFEALGDLPQDQGDMPRLCELSGGPVAQELPTFGPSQLVEDLTVRQSVDEFRFTPIIDITPSDSPSPIGEFAAVGSSNCTLLSDHTAGFSLTSRLGEALSPPSYPHFEQASLVLQDGPQSSSSSTSTSTYAGGDVHSDNEILSSSYLYPISNKTTGRASHMAQKSHLSTSVSPTNWHSVSVTSNNGSGDSWSLFGSDCTLTPSAVETTIYAHKPVFEISPISSWPTSTGPQISPFVGGREKDLICNICKYRPGGIKSKRQAYFKKHMDNHRTNKIPCPDCGKEISRLDNLKIHQRNHCSGPNISGLTFPQPKPHTSTEMVGNPCGISKIRPPKRLRQRLRSINIMNSKMEVA